MTKSQVVWANSHDWFIASTHVEGNYYTVTVRGEACLGEPETIKFSDIKELKEWAGY